MQGGLRLPQMLPADQIWSRARFEHGFFLRPDFIESRVILAGVARRHRGFVIRLGGLQAPSFKLPLPR